jgi:hypothetical protein
MDRATTMRRLILTAVLLAGLVEPAWAGWDEGWKAYKCRHYAIAFREFKALADEGDARAQMTVLLMHIFNEGVVSLEDSNEIRKWMFSLKKDLPPPTRIQNVLR